MLQAAILRINFHPKSRHPTANSSAPRLATAPSSLPHSPLLRPLLNPTPSLPLSSPSSSSSSSAFLPVHQGCYTNQQLQLGAYDDFQPHLNPPTTPPTPTSSLSTPSLSNFVMSEIDSAALPSVAARLAELRAQKAPSSEPNSHQAPRPSWNKPPPPPAPTTSTPAPNLPTKRPPPPPPRPATIAPHGLSTNDRPPLPSRTATGTLLPPPVVPPRLPTGVNRITSTGRILNPKSPGEVNFGGRERHHLPPLGDVPPPVVGGGWGRKSSDSGRSGGAGGYAHSEASSRTSASTAKTGHTVGGGLRKLPPPASEAPPPLPVRAKNGQPSDVSGMKVITPVEVRVNPHGEAKVGKLKPPPPLPVRRPTSSGEKAATTPELPRRKTLPPPMPVRQDKSPAPPPLPTRRITTAVEREADDEQSAYANWPGWRDLCFKCRDFSGPDNHAADPRFDRRNWSSIPKLAAALTEPFDNDLDKARVIFTWHHHNVAYDYDNFLSGSIPDQSAAGVLRSGRSVCQGYAELYLALATAAGLRAELVSGHGKGVGYETGDRLSWPPSGHAWNAIYLRHSPGCPYEGWWFLDACWGAGAVMNGGVWEKNWNPSMFEQPPIKFSHRHFPHPHQKWEQRIPGLRLDYDEYQNLDAHKPPQVVIYSKEHRDPRIAYLGMNVLPCEKRLGKGKHWFEISVGDCPHTPPPSREQCVLLFISTEGDLNRKNIWLMKPREDGKAWGVEVEVPREGCKVKMGWVTSWGGKNEGAVGMTEEDWGRGPRGGWGASWVAAWNE